MEIEKLAKSIWNHFSGIIENTNQKITFGTVKVLNDKIRTAFRRAHRFNAKEHRPMIPHKYTGNNWHAHDSDDPDSFRRSFDVRPVHSSVTITPSLHVL